jgi:hypothetical protein
LTTNAITARADGAGELSATATLRGDQPDPDPSNNDTSATVTVDPALKLSDLINTRSALNGTSVRFALTVATTSTLARRVTVCDTIPAGLKIVAAPGARINGQRVCLTLPRLGTHPRKRTISIFARPYAIPVGGVRAIRDCTTRMGRAGGR